MSAPVQITRTDYSSSDLRQLACQSSDNAQIRRLLSLAEILDGADRETAARIGGMTRQTLRDWVHRYNNEGLDGLKNRVHKGPACRLSDIQKQVLTKLIERGPDMEKTGLVRYRIIDLLPLVKNRFAVHYTESGLLNLVHSLGFSYVSGRPIHPKSDPKKQAEFKSNFSLNAHRKNSSSAS